MNKIYLIGALYDDFSNEGGFSIVAIASTIEKAKDIKYYYSIDNPECKYEIQEWDIDILKPIGKINKHDVQIKSSKLKSYTIIPYKIIK